MKGFVFAALLCFISLHVFSQKKCETNNYFKTESAANNEFAQKYQGIEDFTHKFIKENVLSAQARVTHLPVIKIPVVVHILYHYPQQKIPDAKVHEQIAILNRDFRRRNADTSLTPAAFRNLAADCEIEFQLATSDPRRFSTTGIIKKYTPVTEWENRDKMKFSVEMGSNAWDTKSYLNIWVCKLNDVAGYSSLPGGDINKDGVVIDFSSFGNNPSLPGYDMGRTLVHETGHWLNLKHIWGDSDCGDDGVGDTPQQDIYTVGCPSGIMRSCNNGLAGNMYMNYMDLTNDACMNLFTNGQKARIHSLFAAGGARESMLSSKGLLPPLVIVNPAELPDPQWLFTKIYPNPATDKLKINVEFDSRWIGKIINVTNMSGQAVMQIKITSAITEADISRLQSGIYFLTAKKEDGDFIRHKFIKL